MDKAISATPDQTGATLPKEEKPQVEIVMETTPTVSKKRTDSESSEDPESVSTPKKAKLEPACKFHPFFFFLFNILPRYLHSPLLLALPKASDKKMDIGKEAAIEAEVRAARERALVPLEIRVKSFKEMLKEKDVR